MQHTYLGRTGLKVSRLCLGTMNFGTQTSEADSHAILDRALDSQCEFYRHGRPLWPRCQYGLYRGDHWTLAGPRVDDVTTLCLPPKSLGKWGRASTTVASPPIISAKRCEDSLRRLQTDHIDLYQMHHVDRRTPWEEIWQAMEQLVREGKVLYVGSSNFAGLHIAQAQFAAEKRNFLGLVSEQSLYNLNARTIELELIPACRTFGLGVDPLESTGGWFVGWCATKGVHGSPLQ